MRFRPTNHGVVVTTLLQAFAWPGAQAGDDKGGLRTEFGEVRLHKLAIGKTYSVWRLAETALVMRNTGDEALDVRLQVVVPSHHELRPGARPLPERGWIALERTDFHLRARDTAYADVRLTIPYDPDLAGKTFQVDFWSSAVSAAGTRTAGPVHRLLFTVAMDYRDDTEAQFSSRSPDR